MQIGILEGNRFSARARADLTVIGSVELFAGGQLETFLADKEILFVRLGFKIDSDFLDLAPQLKWICSPTTGHNHLDTEEMASRGIGLISLRGEREFLSRIRATPEHTLGLMLALLRNYRQAFVDSNNRHWDRDRCRGDELFGMNVGIVGLGRVGVIVADYLEVLGAHVYFVDVRPEVVRDNCTRCDSLEALIETTELVVMCASYVDGQKPVLDEHLVGLLAGKYFVNTARGELVYESALLALVRRNEMKGVATDVITDENGANRLDEWLEAASETNTIVTPHIAGATWNSMAATEEFIAQKLLKQLGYAEK